MSSPRRPGADAPARLADVETLRRLTRDAFAEITSVRDRLRDLERSVATERASRAADRARVDTRVEVCTASPARGRRDARRRGSRVRATTTVETPFDDGDALFVRLATAAADGRGATSLDASSRDASFRGRDGGRRGGDGEGGHAHAGCSTSVRRSEATDSRVSAGASGAEQRPRASTPDCRMSISAVYLRF